MDIRIIELMILVIIAAISDVRTMKVRNKLIVTFMVIGIITNVIKMGPRGLIFSTIGIFVPIIILFILYALKMMGASDIKLFGAIGAIMGVEFVLKNIMYSILAGGVLAVILLVIRKNGMKRMKYLFTWFKGCMLTGKVSKYKNIGAKDDSEFWFALCIMVGTIAQLLLS